MFLRILYRKKKINALLLFTKTAISTEQRQMERKRGKEDCFSYKLLKDAWTKILISISEFKSVPDDIDASI